MDIWSASHGFTAPSSGSESGTAARNLPSDTASPNWDTTSASDGAGSGAAAVVVAGSDGGGVSRARSAARAFCREFSIPVYIYLCF